MALLSQKFEHTGQNTHYTGTYFTVVQQPASSSVTSGYLRHKYSVSNGSEWKLNTSSRCILCFVDMVN